MRIVNGLAFAAAAALPAPVLIPLNFDGMYGYYAYRLPVAGSYIEGAYMSYVNVREEDYAYFLDFHYAAHHPSARTYTGDGRTGPLLLPQVTGITPLDSQTIQVDMDDGNYTIYSGESHRTYNPLPVFSHSETIRVNQTFVTRCIDGPPPWREEDAGGNTCLLVIQYRGLDTREVAVVREYMPFTEGVTDEWSGTSNQGGRVYATRTVHLDPPREIPVYKFLVASACTEGRMPCDYPQVIEHTIDAKRIGPADVKAMRDGLYEWYR